MLLIRHTGKPHAMTRIIIMKNGQDMQNDHLNNKGAKTLLLLKLASF